MANIYQDSQLMRPVPKHWPQARRNTLELPATQIENSVQRAMEKPRVAIEQIAPCVDNGRYPAKGIVGQPLVISATIFSDGHNRLAASVLWREINNKIWSVQPMRLLENDRWEAYFIPQTTGLHYFKVEAWLDRWQNYFNELQQKFSAGINVELEVEEGRLLLLEIFNYAVDTTTVIVDKKNALTTAQKKRHEALDILQEALLFLNEARVRMDVNAQVMVLLRQDLAAAIALVEPRHFLVRSQSTFVVDVERKEAGFSSWYELFPRSITSSKERHGTFDDVIQRLPAIKKMGFDVLYFPPIHPIGQKFRKGSNNQIHAKPGEPGSPYAIGSIEGGHDAVHPELGGIEAFRRLRAAAQEQGIEIALDFAIQCSPDHPWLKTHPDWFSWRPDGSLRYAENPPKKYQDIVNVDFYARGAMPSLWLAWREIILYWISEGVTIFRVDNPHTKPLPFWQWLIAEIRSHHPETLFLSEAFTRPAMMYQLAKIGFSQSYTYFIWRNTKHELIEYMKELSSPPVRDFYRPHFFVNTPDINPFFTQHSGRAGFLIRSALAATLSGLWGMYSGFEYCESAALPGKEEYLDSEKYEIKPRDFSSSLNIIEEITQLNRIRKENPALHMHWNVEFHESENDQVIFFSKSFPVEAIADAHLDDQRHIGEQRHEAVPMQRIWVAISLNPHQPQHAHLHMNVGDLPEPKGEYYLTELMRNIALPFYTANGKNTTAHNPDSIEQKQPLSKTHRQHWYFDPTELPFAIWRLEIKGAEQHA